MKKIIVCRDCRWLREGHWDSYSGLGCDDYCKYKIYGKKINAVSAYSGPYTYTETTRIKNYRIQNMNNDCEYFQEKFSIFKWIKAKLRKEVEL